MTIDPSVVAAVEASVTADPENVPLRLHLAGLLLDTGRAPAALVHCTAALTRQPDDPTAIGLAARAAEAEGDARLTAAYHRLEAALAAPVGAAAGDGWGVDAADQDWDRLLEEVLAADDPRQARPTLTLADVGGMDDVKQRLEGSLLEPLRRLAEARKYGRNFDRRPRGSGGMLLWGPPGCGKTFLAQAAAAELGARFVPVRLHDVLDSWPGQSEQNLHALFTEARRQAPCLVLIDEIDALGHKRSDLTRSPARNIVVQLLNELDGQGSVNDGIFVLAATNQLWDVDPALRRPGRLDQTVCVLPPDEAARKVILEHHLRDLPLGVVDLADVARRTDGYSGADLRMVCDRAAERAAADQPAAAVQPAAAIQPAAAVQPAPPRPITGSDLLDSAAEIRASTRSWFETARNYVMFANTDGEYDAVKSYLRRHRGSRT